MFNIFDIFLLLIVINNFGLEKLLCLPLPSMVLWYFVSFSFPCIKRVFRIFIGHYNQTRKSFILFYFFFSAFFFFLHIPPTLWHNDAIVLLQMSLFCFATEYIRCLRMFVCHVVVDVTAQIDYNETYNHQWI